MAGFIRGNRSGRHDVLVQDGLIIVQIDPKEYRDLGLKRVILDDQRKYGRTMLCFYQPEESKST